MAINDGILTPAAFKTQTKTETVQTFGSFDGHSSDMTQWPTNGHWIKFRHEENKQQLYIHNSHRGEIYYLTSTNPLTFHFPPQRSDVTYLLIVFSSQRNKYTQWTLNFPHLERRRYASYHFYTAHAHYVPTENVYIISYQSHFAFCLCNKFSLYARVTVSHFYFSSLTILLIVSTTNDNNYRLAIIICVYCIADNGCTDVEVFIMAQSQMPSREFLWDMFQK